MVAEWMAERKNDRGREAEWAVECMGHVEEWRRRLESKVKEERDVELGTIREIRRRLERVRVEEKRRGLEEREKVVAEWIKKGEGWRREEERLKVKIKGAGSKVKIKGARLRSREQGIEGYWIRELREEKEATVAAHTQEGEGGMGEGKGEFVGEDKVSGEKEYGSGQRIGAEGGEEDAGRRRRSETGEGQGGGGGRERGEKEQHRDKGHGMEGGKVRARD